MSCLYVVRVELCVLEQIVQGGVAAGVLMMGNSVSIECHPEAYKEAIISDSWSVRDRIIVKSPQSTPLAG